jgi:hypothetical protein
MVRCPHYLLNITENITKKQMDMVIDKVNNRLNKENSKWYMKYDGNSVDTKYWVSYEIKSNGEAMGQEQDIFFSLRISAFQYKDKYIDIHNNINQIKELPDDTYILTKNGNYHNKILRGLNIYLYHKNISSYEIKQLLGILNKELNKFEVYIIRKVVECNRLVDLNDVS